MKGSFIENASLGKNKWWHYALSIFSVVVVVAILNIIVRQALPDIKQLFPDSDFGKGLFTYSLVLVIFGLALFAFLLVASKLHQRPKMSFISTKGTFSWRQYIIGFVAWGSLLFIGSTIFDYQKLEDFVTNFNFYQFASLFLLGFVAIGVQSFFEELVVRGYLLQGMHLLIKKVVTLVILNSLVFGVLHFGYGIESFLSSWVFGVAFAVIVMLQNRIEFVSGAHNANNLILSIIFLDLSEASNEAFSWQIDWGYFSIHVFSLLILVGLVYKFLRKSQRI
ncbi:MAG: CPBP family intramembrane metalloprotease [Cytophagales bacterium]|nr:CPBP family intramembrane metalloprotease [Cytophagales bacterium]MCA6396089.1 CPBP family intramembrane metalloprotease [Cytophagales bacterium]MCA6403343.1 CPBP family intramembrane metalloprotease [Cytophagales bacterium]MCA6420147.1 CPBP family intramembrane metalloprotease [Cytophagales bacterium]MCA6426457.1 CPBP family intramembrane metalloprotease [Cytophagales bacterium]